MAAARVLARVENLGENDKLAGEERRGQEFSSFHS
jgi:hypothetical protein